MAGEGGLNRYIGGLLITNLANHDDVRVLTHQGTNPFSETQTGVGLYLGLIKRTLDHFDRVFDGADIEGRFGKGFQARIEGGGFARTGGARYQNNAVGVFDQLIPAAVLILAKTE